MNQVCFVIMPIMKEGSAGFDHLDTLYRQIILPAAKGLGIVCVRADEISKGQNFIRDVAEYLYTADIVIAVLTNNNPNVMWELGVRHGLRKKTVVICKNETDLPSNLRPYRSLIYGSIDDFDNLKERLTQFIQNALDDQELKDNPISEFVSDKLATHSFSEPQMLECDFNGDRIQERVVAYHDRYGGWTLHFLYHDGYLIKAINIEEYDASLELQVLNIQCHDPASVSFLKRITFDACLAVTENSLAQGGNTPHETGRLFFIPPGSFALKCLIVQANHIDVKGEFVESMRAISGWVLPHSLHVCFTFRSRVTDPMRSAQDEWCLEDITSEQCAVDANFKANWIEALSVFETRLAKYVDEAGDDGEIDKKAIKEIRSFKNALQVSENSDRVRTFYNQFIQRFFSYKGVLE